MGKISVRLGLWAARLITVSFLLYTAAYVIIVALFPIPHWSGLSDFSNSIQEPWYIIFTICQILAFITAPLFIILINSIYDYTEGSKKVLARASLFFTIIFAALSSIHYFIQFSTVRLSILQNQLQGLEHFIQLNPVSAIAAVNLLGWTLFFGLSSLFIYPVFGNSSLEKVLKYSFLANGIFCIIGAIGYILNIPVLQLLFFNGMGIAVIIIGITSSLLFGKLEKSSR